MAEIVYGLTTQQEIQRSRQVIVFITELIVGCMLLAVLYHMSGLLEEARKLSNYQTTADVKELYARCVADAPENMDCVMIPMLVSKRSIKDILNGDSP